MKILLATSNPHKLDEILSVFQYCASAPIDKNVDRCASEHDAESLPVQLVTLADVGLAYLEEPVEDADTFEGNAVLKAIYYAKAANMLCLADDSGLEVDALGGEPGVKSARYSGKAGARSVVDPANNQLVIERLGETPVKKRTARFVCAMALCEPDQTAEPVAVVRGTVEGRMLTMLEAGERVQGLGENGFGYDPLFYLPELKKTSAQLSPEHKNRISHRGDASRKMWAQLQALGRLG